MALKVLRDRILQEGRCLEGGILKVDRFVNHQLDPYLMKQVAIEFIRRFSDVKVNKILTIEASGIAPAVMLGYLMELPVVYVKKKVRFHHVGVLSVGGAFVHQDAFLRCDYQQELSHGRRPCALHRRFPGLWQCRQGNHRPVPSGGRHHRGHGLHHRERVPARARAAPVGSASGASSRWPSSSRSTTVRLR